MNIKNIAASGLLAASLLAPGVVLAAPDIIVTYIPGETGGLTPPTISDDGRYLAYRLFRKVASGPAPSDIMIRDMVSGEEVQANMMPGGGAPTTNAMCTMPALSRNGRFVSFGCRASAMGVYAQKGDAYFVYDRINNKTEMIPDLGEDFVSLGVPTAISADGRFVAFLTVRAPNQYTLFVRDIVNKTTTATVAQSTTVAVVPSPMSISADGRYITYIARPTPSNTAGEVYVHDRVTGATEVVNVKSNGTRSSQPASQASASDDATIVAFTSTDGELVNPRGPTTSAVYVRDRKTGVTELISPRTAGAGSSTVSGNGRYVAYAMSNIVYVYDRLTKTTRHIVAPKVRSLHPPRMSADGRYVVGSGSNSVGEGGSIVVADMGIAAGVSLSSRELTLTEGGIAATYSMSLTQAPDADVKILIGTGAQLSLARTELVFTPENWSVPQVVSVQAVADGVSEGRHTTTIVHTVTSTDVNYAVVEPANVAVTITDGVTPTIMVPAATWNRSDMPLTGTAAPGATVMLTAMNRTTGWMSSVSTVANAQGQWSYTMTGFTDGIVDLDAQAEGIRSAVQTVIVKLVVVPPLPTFTDVTGYIRTTAYGLAYNRSTGKYAGNFVITNTGSIKLSGPLHLVLKDLTTGVSLVNATGTHEGAPYITVQGDLEPDGSMTIPLIVDNPAKVGVNYAAKIYSGTF